MGLGAATRRERREKTREDFLWLAELRSLVLRCWAIWGWLCSSRVSNPVRLQTHSYESDQAVWPSKEEDLRNCDPSLEHCLVPERAFFILLTKYHKDRALSLSVTQLSVVPLC